MVDTLGEESYKDSALIMELLRQNLMLWISDLQARASGATPGARPPAQACARVSGRRTGALGVQCGPGIQRSKAVG